MNAKTKKMLKENNAVEKQLSRGTQEVMTDIVVYLRGSGISESEQERVRRDIFLMLKEGEERGEDPAQIIGEDMQAFCDEILSEVPKMTVKQRTIEMASILMNSMGVLLLIYGFLAMIPTIKKNGFQAAMRLDFTFGELLSFGIILLATPLIFLVITRISFRIKKKSIGILFYIGLCLVLLVILLPTLFLQETAFAVVWWTVLALGAALIFISSMTDRYFGS